MPTVFISHATQEAQFARRLAADLKRSGVQIWIAPESIRPGERWVRAIDRGLAESSHMVIVLTPAALKSKWVEMETDAAIAQERKGRIKVIPLDVEPCDVPPLLSGYQMVSFRRDYDASLRQLTDILGVRVTPPEVPVPPAPKVVPTKALGRGALLAGWLALLAIVSIVVFAITDLKGCLPATEVARPTTPTPTVAPTATPTLIPTPTPRPPPPTPTPIPTATFTWTPTSTPPTSVCEGEKYTVQKEDSLETLAEKYLGNRLAYLAIIYYTNEVRAEDDSFAEISYSDPLLGVGWKIYIPEAGEYTVQKEDSLETLAEKYLGNRLAYPAIIYATNQKYAEDDSFAEIPDPSPIQPGSKICIPNVEEAEAYLRSLD